MEAKHEIDVKLKLQSKIQRKGLQTFKLIGNGKKFGEPIQIEFAISPCFQIVIGGSPEDRLIKLQQLFLARKEKLPEEQESNILKLFGMIPQTPFCEDEQIYNMLKACENNLDEAYKTINIAIKVRQNK